MITLVDVLKKRQELESSEADYNQIILKLMQWLEQNSSALDKESSD